jgi:hypothetical protein
VEALWASFLLGNKEKNMRDFYLVAEAEEELLEALPEWLSDGVDVLPRGQGFEVLWDIPVPKSREFHAVVRVLDETLAEDVVAQLGDYMAPKVGRAWQED